MWTRFITLAVVALPIAAAGCGPATQQSTSSDSSEGWIGSASAEQREIMLSVRNDNWSSVVVYVERDGRLVRLGSVQPLTDRTFNLSRWGMAGGGMLSIIARPRNAPAGYNSGRISVNPGHQLDVRLANRLEVSTIMVR
jgi:hypothetical protein